MNGDKEQPDSYKEHKKSNARRIEQLIDVVEKYTRTEKHLEENLAKSTLDDVKHTLKIQEERKAEIANLKNIIAYGIHEQVDENDNLLKNYTYANNYLDHNASRMDELTLESTKEKQEHRKNQMELNRKAPLY